MNNLLEKINRASIKFLVPQTPAEVYSTIVDEAIKLVGADFGSIYLYRENGGDELEKVYANQPFLFKIKARKRGFTFKAFKANKPSIIDTESIEKIHPEIKRKGIKSIIYIPLSYKNSSIGLLSLDSLKRKYFNSKGLSILRLFGSMASLAIRKNQLYTELTQAIVNRDLFIAMATHELRTPLTTINGYVQMLKNRIPDELPTEKRWVEELSWEATRLTKLVQELVQVEQAKTGQLQYSWQECSFRVILSRAFTDFRFTHPGREVIFADLLVGQSDLIVADFDKIMQVIINLLDNAAKFSSPAHPIHVTLKGDGNIVTLKIKNRGKGIAVEELEKIFEGFYKGTSGKEKSGMGLGLFLAKNIIDQHHGTITVHSKPHKETIFEIKLPILKGIDGRI